MSIYVCVLPAAELHICDNERKALTICTLLQYKKIIPLFGDTEVSFHYTRYFLYEQVYYTWLVYGNNLNKHNLLVFCLQTMDLIMELFSKQI